MNYNFFRSPKIRQQGRRPQNTRSRWQIKRLNTSGTEEQMEVLFIAPLSFPDISAWIISPPTTMNSDNHPNSQNQPNFKNQKIMGRPSWYFKIKTLNKFGQGKIVLVNCGGHIRNLKNLKV